MNRLVSTKEMTRDDWLRWRRTGIGGSDAGAICGVNPFVSAMKIYLDKISDEATDYDNEAMKQGRELEDYVAKRFMEETGKKVKRTNYMYSNLKYPFMLANVDRLVVGENAGLECKTLSPYSADQWKNGSIPAHYYYQCLHYMTVTGADHWYIAALILGKEFIWRRIDRDEEAIRLMMQKEEAFWNENVMKRIPPEPDGTDASETFIKDFYKETIKGKSIALKGIGDELRRHSELISKIKDLEKDKRLIEERIKVSMNDAETALTEGYVISWKKIQSEKLDTESLKKDYPELYEKYSKLTSYRRFSIQVA